MPRKYQMAVARLRPPLHDAVKRAASPKVGTFSGIDSMIQTALLLLMGDLANDAEFKKAYRTVYNEDYLPPGDEHVTGS